MYSPNSTRSEQARESQRFEESNSLPKKPDQLGVSIIIPTYNRPEDLSETLRSILAQTLIPQQVIVVDDSQEDATQRLVLNIEKEFRDKGIEVIYTRDPHRRSLTIARNLGARLSKEEIVLFLDDDVTLDQEYVGCILKVYSDRPEALGVQGYWFPISPPTLSFLLTQALSRTFFKGYYSKQRCFVQPSFESTYPYKLESLTQCQSLSGCNQSYRRTVFERFIFDEKLGNYAPGEDLDLSYRVFKSAPYSLFITPTARLVHRVTPLSRIPQRRLVYLSEVYKEYLFRKNMKQTAGCRMAFAWSRIGTLLFTTMSAARRRKSTGNPYAAFKCYLGALVLCIRHRKDIREGDLSFIHSGLESVP